VHNIEARQSLPAMRGPGGCRRLCVSVPASESGQGRDGFRSVRLSPESRSVARVVSRSDPKTSHGSAIRSLSGCLPTVSAAMITRSRPRSVPLRMTAAPTQSGSVTRPIRPGGRRIRSRLADAGWPSCPEGRRGVPAVGAVRSANTDRTAGTLGRDPHHQRGLPAGWDGHGRYERTTRASALCNPVNA